MFYVVFFPMGGQIRSRHQYGWGQHPYFQQNHNATIALSAPDGGGNLHCQLRWGAHGRICPPPWIRHCAEGLQVTASEYLIKVSTWQLQWNSNFETATLRTKGAESTNEPPRPT